LSRRIDVYKDKLLSMMSRIEASIDFPEHDIEEMAREDTERGHFSNDRRPGKA
jgi:tRNA U34 5-carboxymethylaminomethyl modifying GTPase MnmE/TrmE